MHYLRLSGHKNIWGWRCLLEHCHEWIWFNFEHWKTNLKVILEAPTNSFCFFLWHFFPFENPQGRKTPRWSTHKMSEHGRPRSLSPNTISEWNHVQWVLLSPWGWGEERKTPKEPGLPCPNNVWWLYMNSTDFGPHIMFLNELKVNKMKQLLILRICNYNTNKC